MTIINLEPKHPNSKSFAKAREAKFAENLAPAEIKAPEIPAAPPDWNKEKKLAALWAKRNWWLGTMSNLEIQEAVGCPTWQIRNWVFGDSSTDGWKVEREAYNKKLLQGEIQSNATRIRNLMDKMLKVLEDSASYILDNNAKLNIDQYAKFTTSLESLFKLNQLLLGKPTEIYENQLMTWNQVVEKLKKVDVIEYTELVPAPTIEATIGTTIGVNGKILDTGTTDTPPA